MLFFVFFALFKIAFADVWTVESPPGPSPSRRDHDSAYLSASLDHVLYGGASTSVVSETWIFSLVNQNWQKLDLSPNPGPLMGLTLTAIGTDAIVLFGGEDNSKTVSRSVWKFTVANGWAQMQPTGDAPDARSFHSAVAIQDPVANGNPISGIIMFGGDVTSGSEAQPSNDVWKLNVRDFSWTRLASQGPPPRYGHSAVYMLSTDGGSMYVFGGVGQSSILGDLWRFSLKDNTWTALTTVGSVRPSARAFHAAVIMGGNMIVSGGEADSVSSETWLFDPFNIVWRQLIDTGAPLSVSHHSFIPVSDTFSITYGGVTLDSTSSDAMREIKRHSTNAKWTSLIPSAQSPSGRVGFVAQIITEPSAVTTATPGTPASSDSVYFTDSMWVLGGTADGGVTRLGDIWRFDGSNSRWAQITPAASSPMPGPHAYAGSVLYSQYIVVIGGGTRGSGMWAFNVRNLIWSELRDASSSTLPLGLNRERMGVGISLESGTASVVVAFGRTFNDTTIQNSVVQMPIMRVEALQSSTDKMLSFDGENDFVQAWTGRAYLPSNDRGFALEAWFRLLNPMLDGLTLLSWGPSSGNAMRVFYNAETGGLCVAGYDTLTPCLCGKTQIIDDNWHHVLVSFTFASNAARPAIIYVDGNDDTATSGNTLSLDSSVNIDNLFIGAYFPAATPYIVTTYVGTGLPPTYRFLGNAPYWKGYVDAVSVYNMPFTPLLLSQISQSISTELVVLGCYDFNVVNLDGTLQDCSGTTDGSITPAILGTPGRILTRPTPKRSSRPSASPLTYNATLPTWVVPGWTTLYSTDSEAASAVQGTTYPHPVYSHSLVMIGTNFYMRGGISAQPDNSGYLPDVWTFNILTQTWTILAWQNVGAGVANHAAVAVTISNVLQIAYFGGEGTMPSGLIEFSLTQTPALGLLVDMRPTAVANAQNDLDIGHGLSVSFVGMYAGLRSSGDSLFVFGGSVNGIMSSQIYSVSVSNVLSLDLLRVVVVGQVPPVRLTQPAAVAQDSAIFLAGKIGRKELWKVGLNSLNWDLVNETGPADGTATPGFAVANINSNLQSLGQACDTFTPEAQGSNAGCAIENGLYILSGLDSSSSSSPYWNKSRQALATPSSFSKEGASTGVVTLYPDLCGYGGRHTRCAPDPFPPLVSTAYTDAGPDVGARFAVGNQTALWISVWSSAPGPTSATGSDSDIFFSLSDDGGHLWSVPAPLNSNARVDIGDDSNPFPIWSDSFGGWLVVWESTDSVWGSVDADLLFSTFPHFDNTAFCGSIVPAAIEPAPGTVFSSFSGLRIATSTPISPSSGTLGPSSAVTVVVSVWVAGSGWGVNSTSNSTMRMMQSVSVSTSAKTWSTASSFVLSSNTAINAIKLNANSTSINSTLPSVPHVAYIGNSSFLSAWQSGSGSEARIVISRRPPGFTPSPPGQCSNGSAPIIVNGASGSVVRRNYSFGDNCQWLLAVPESTGINLRFRDGFLTRGATDVLRVYDGSTTASPLLTTLSGNLTSPSPLSTNGPYILLSFSAQIPWTVNNSLPASRSGFSVEYTATLPFSATDYSKYTWSFPSFVPSSQIAPQHSPSILWPGGSSSTVWMFFSSGLPTPTVCYTTSQDHGNTWSSAASLFTTNANGRIDHAIVSAVSASGVIVVVWEARFLTNVETGKDTDIYFSTSLNNGAEWNGVNILNADYAGGDSFDDKGPAIAVNSNGLFIVVWSSSQGISNAGSDTDLVFSKSPGGIQWTAPALLHPYSATTDVGMDQAPRITVSATNIFTVAWRSSSNLGGVTGYDFDVYASESTDSSGSAWSSPRAINADAQGMPMERFSVEVISTGSGSTQLVAWTQTDGTQVNIVHWKGAKVVSATCPYLQSWSFPLPLSPSMLSDSQSDSNVFLTKMANKQILATWQLSPDLTNSATRYPFNFASVWARLDLTAPIVQLSTPDLSGNSRDGTVSTTGVSMVPDSKFQLPVATFDGSTRSAITISTNAFPTKTMSISMWFKSSGNTLGALFSYASQSLATTLVVDKLGAALLHSTFSLTTGIAVTDQLWHHFALTWSLRDCSAVVYLDGIIAFSGVLGRVGVSAVNGEGVFIIGQRQTCFRGCFSAGHAFTGSMAYFSIFDRIVTAKEVASLATYYQLSRTSLLSSVTNDGILWTSPAAPVAVSGDNRKVTVVQLAMSPRLVMVWQSSDSRSGGDYDILVAISDDSASTWTEPLAIASTMNTDSGDDSNPSVVSYVSKKREEMLLVAWQSPTDFTASSGRSTGSDVDLWYVRTLSRGDRWTGPVVLNPNAYSDTSDDANVDVSVNSDGNWLSVWVSTNPNVGGRASQGKEIIFSRSSNAGTQSAEEVIAWSPPARISDSRILAGEDSNPRLTIFPDGWAVVWESTDSQSNTIGTDTDLMWAETPWRDPSFVCQPNFPSNDSSTIAVWPTWIRDYSFHISPSGIAIFFLTAVSNRPFNQSALANNTSTQGFLLRSRDSGKTWPSLSGPLPEVFQRPATESQSLMTPTIRGGAQQRWVAAWVSQSTIEDLTAPSFDQVLYVTNSSDDGETWYSPAKILDQFSIPNSALKAAGYSTAGFKMSPNLATSGISEWYLVWSRPDPNGHMSIYYAHSTNNAETWNAIRPLAPLSLQMGGSNLAASVAYSAGLSAWAVAWSSTSTLWDDSDSDIFVSFRPHRDPWVFCSTQTHTTRSFSSLLSNTTSTTSLGLAVGALDPLSGTVPAGEVLAVWAALSPDGRPTIFSSRSLDFGNTFSGATAIANGTSGDGDTGPSVLYVGNSTFVSVFIRSPTSGDLARNAVYTSVFDRFSHAWKSSDVPVHNSTLGAGHTSVISDGYGSAIVVFCPLAGGVSFAVSGDYGVTWGAVGTIPGSELTVAVAPRGAWSAIDAEVSGTIVVVWQGRWRVPAATTGLDWDIFSATSSDGGLTWGPVVVLNSNAATDTGDDIHPEIATDSSANFLLVWQSNDALANTLGDDVDLLFSYSADSGATWTPAAALNTNADKDSGWDRAHSVSVTSAKIWTVVWLSDENLFTATGNDVDVFVSESSSGVAWSAPRTMDKTATNDTCAEGFPTVTANQLAGSSSVRIAAWPRCGSSTPELVLESWSGGALSTSSCGNIDAWSTPSMPIPDPQRAEKYPDVNVKVATAGAANTYKVALAWSASNAVFRHGAFIAGAQVTWDFSRTGPQNPDETAQPKDSVRIATDISGLFSNPGVLLKSVRVVGDSHFPSGQIYLDGSSTSGVLGKMQNMGQPTATGITVALWVRLDASTPPTGTLASLTSLELTDEFSLVNLGGAVVVLGTTYPLERSSVPRDSLWHHYGISWDKTRLISVTLDGVLRYQTVTNPTDLTFSDSLSLAIGQRQGCYGGCFVSGAALIGYVGPVVAFNRILTADEYYIFGMDTLISVAPPSYIGTDADIAYAMLDSSWTWVKSGYANTNADSDFGDDTAPSIVGGASGSDSFNVAWESDDAGPKKNLGTDVDIMYAYWTPATAKWSAPVAVSENGDKDENHDYHPRLIVTPAGSLQGYSLRALQNFYSLATLSLNGGGVSAGSPVIPTPVWACPIPYWGDVSLPGFSSASLIESVNPIFISVGTEGKITFIWEQTGPLVSPNAANVLLTGGSSSQLISINGNNLNLSWSGVASPIFNLTSNHGYPFAPKVISNARSETVMVWTDTTSDSSDHVNIVSSTYSSTSATWTKPALLNTAGDTSNVNELDADLAVGALGHFYCVWRTQSVTVDPAVWVSVSADGSAGSWRTAVQISSAGVTLDFTFGPPRIASTSAGVVVVVWSQDVRTVSTGAVVANIYFSRSADDCVTWSVPQLVGGPQENANQYPSLSTNLLGVWLIAWQSNNTNNGLTGSDFDILFSRSTDNGVTWSSPVPLQNDASILTSFGADTRPSVAFEPLTPCVLCTWSSGESFGNLLGNDADIMFSISNDGGLSWTQGRAVNNDAYSDTENDLSPSLFRDGNGWYVSWLRATDNGNVLHMSSMSSGTFLAGTLTNMAGENHTSFKFSRFGTSFSSRIGKGSTPLSQQGAFVITRNSTANATTSIGLMTTRSRWLVTDIPALTNIIPGFSMTIALGDPVLSQSPRWGVASEIYSEDVGSDSLIVHGGRDAEGLIGTLSVVRPATGKWEEIRCDGEAPAPLANHGMIKYKTSAGPAVLVVGAPNSLGSVLTAKVWRISNLRHLDKTLYPGFATATCNSPTILGTYPQWSSYSRIVLYLSHFLILDTDGTTAVNPGIFHLDISTDAWAWSILVGIENPPIFSSYFSAVISASFLYVVGVSSGAVGIQSVNLERDSPELSFASGANLNSAQTGFTSIVDINSKTCFSTAGHGYDMSVELVGDTRARGQRLAQQVAQGVFRFTYVLRKPGSYTLHAKVSGSHLPGSPFPVEASAGETSLQKSEIDISTAVATALPGVLTTYTIEAKDVFGNLGKGGDDISVRLKKEVDTWTATVKDNSDGTYLISYTLTQSGNYNLFSLLNGLNLTGSPSPVVVNPGSPDPANFLLSGEGLAASVNAGQGRTILVQCADSFGNNITNQLADEDMVLEFFEDITHPTQDAYISASSRRRHFGSTSDGAPDVRNRRSLLSRKGRPINTESIKPSVVAKANGIYAVGFFSFVDGYFIYFISYQGQLISGLPLEIQFKSVGVSGDDGRDWRSFATINIVTLICVLGVFFNPTVLAAVFNFIKHRMSERQKLIKKKQQEARKLASRGLTRNENEKSFVLPTRQLQAPTGPDRAQLWPRVTTPKMRHPSVESNKLWESNDSGRVAPQSVAEFQKATDLFGIPDISPDAPHDPALSHSYTQRSLHSANAPAYAPTPEIGFVIKDSTMSHEIALQAAQAAKAAATAAQGSQKSAFPSTPATIEMTPMFPSATPLQNDTRVTSQFFYPNGGNTPSIPDPSRPPPAVFPVPASTSHWQYPFSQAPNPDQFLSFEQDNHSTVM